MLCNSACTLIDMSNLTNAPVLPVLHRTDHFNEGTLDFTRDKLSLGHTEFDVYTPSDGRDQHMHVSTWQAKLDKVDGIVTTNGDACTTLHLTVDGRTVQVALWGVHLDDLATAVIAAQIDGVADAD